MIKVNKSAGNFDGALAVARANTGHYYSVKTSIEIKENKKNLKANFV